MGKKWDDATPGMKMLTLFTLLFFSNGRKWSLTSLSERLNSSKRSVLNLIGQMELSTACRIVKTKANRQSYYHIEKTANASQLSLAPVSLDNLLMCRDFVWHLLPQDARSILEATVNQVAAMVSPQGKEDGFPGNSYSRRKFRGYIDYSPFQGQFSVLTKAIVLRHVCSISYRNSLDADPREFRFAPFELVVLQDTIYVRGWMIKDDSRHPSTLALHRIREASMLDGSFADFSLPPPYGHDAQFGIIEGEPFEATIRFGPGAALYVAERIWSQGQKVRILDDGGAELTMTANNSCEVKSWVLSFGRDARVLSPSWLRGEIAQELRELGNEYAGAGEEGRGQPS